MLKYPTIVCFQITSTKRFISDIIINIHTSVYIFGAGVSLNIHSFACRVVVGSVGLLISHIQQLLNFHDRFILRVILSVDSAK